MPVARLPILAVAIALPALTAQAQQRDSRGPAQGRMTTTTVTIQQRMIIRVPRMSTPRGSAIGLARPPATVQWAEKKAGKCVALIDIAAAALPGSDSVDLIMNGGARIRAKLDKDCRALDFYSGFYVRMTPDGKACASRDAFRSRAGGECRIKAFRTLVAKR
ncbi:hypothetical protein ACFSC3_04305 [Sphingomonas floccifaciens]|uniref:DUF3617 family protein n=1 Tax=Sphingomonas floccifaciens TaxID=1844115 RepID=A0ABW4NBE3_9SPHN